MVGPCNDRLLFPVFHVVLTIVCLQVGSRQPFDDYIAVLQLNADPMALTAFANIEGRAAAAERIKHNVAFLR